jgi:membrane-bound lytic murein transglycosylase F
LAGALLVCGSCGLLSGCGDAIEDQARGRLDQEALPRQEAVRDLPEIQAEGVLRILTVPDPATYMLFDGEERGFEHDLADLFAEEWNLRLEAVVPAPGEDLFSLLESGRGDLVAAGLIEDNLLRKKGLMTRAVTYDRLRVYFSPGSTVPDTTLSALQDATVWVPSYGLADAALRDLRDRLGLHLRIVHALPAHGVEDLLWSVSTGEAPAVAVGERTAQAAMTAGIDLQPGPALEELLPVVWLVRRDSPELKGALDRFLKRNIQGGPTGTRRSHAYGVLEDHYFVDAPKIRWHRQDSRRPALSGRLSPWDEIIQDAAAAEGFDWLLIASLIYEESRFDPAAQSRAGAVGLMQVIPRFAQDDSTSLADPETNIRTGVAQLAEIHRGFAYLDSLDRLYFTLATYHAGGGHMNDARRLTMDIGRDPNRWRDNVEVGLMRLRDSDRSARARYGFYRGDRSVRYAESILYRYKVYRYFLGRYAFTAG